MKRLPWRIDLPPDYRCPSCGHDCIELFTEYGKPCRYKTIVKTYEYREELMTSRFNKTPLSHFECVHCGQIFPISWRYGYPVPYTGGIYYDAGWDSA